MNILANQMLQVQQSKKEVAAEFAEDAEAGMILAFRFFDQDGSQTINLSEFHGVTTVVGVEFTKLERRALCGFVEDNHLSSSAKVVGIQADLEDMGVDCTGQTTYEDFEAAVLQIDMARCGVGINL